MIKIYDYVPNNFSYLAWGSQYRKFGVVLQEIFCPFNFNIGVVFKKGKKVKCVVLSPNCENEVAVRNTMLAVEDEFGIPMEASPYNQTTLTQVTS